MPARSGAARCVERQQARSDRAHRNRRDVAAANSCSIKLCTIRSRTIEQLPAQRAEVVPPDAVSILLDMARGRRRDAVRHDGRAQHFTRRVTTAALLLYVPMSTPSRSSFMEVLVGGTGSCRALCSPS